MARGRGADGGADDGAGRGGPCLRALASARRRPRRCLRAAPRPQRGDHLPAVRPALPGVVLEMTPARPSRADDLCPKRRPFAARELGSKRRPSASAAQVCRATTPSHPPSRPRAVLQHAAAAPPLAASVVLARPRSLPRKRHRIPVPSPPASPSLCSARPFPPSRARCRPEPPRVDASPVLIPAGADRHRCRPDAGGGRAAALNFGHGLGL